MVTQVKEAHSVHNKVPTRDDVLRRIPGRHIDSIVFREHLDRELVLGTIGDRGGGKSATCAVLGIVAFMMSGKPVWSNMKISLDLEIEDAMAKDNGLNHGGVVHYESLPLEKEALLKLDDSYRDGCLVIEEINVQYSNVRRFMTNTNINFNEVCQQLRKFRTSLLYNVIDEMFIDSQLRALTDIFIYTYDTAFDLDSLTAHKQTGLDFCWKIFPMSGYLKGEQGKYVYAKRTEKAYFHFGPWRGVFDSFRHQEKGIYTQSTKELNAALKGTISLESSPEMKEETDEFAWLDEKAIMLKNRGITELQPYELWTILELNKRKIRPDSIGGELGSRGIHRDDNKRVYRIDNYSVEDILARAGRSAQTI